MLKKLKTPQQIAQQKKKNNIIIGSILIGLMAFSTLGFSIMSQNNENQEIQTVNEKGYEFYLNSNRWYTNSAGTPLSFEYLPSQVSNVPVSASISLQQYASNPLYIVRTSAGITDILQIISPYVSRYQEACLQGYTCMNQDLPLKTCEDNILVYEKGKRLENNENNSNYEYIDESITQVVQDQNCIFLTGDTLKSSNAFAFHLLNIR